MLRAASVLLLVTVASPAAQEAARPPSRAKPFRSRRVTLAEGEQFSIDLRVTRR